MATSFLQRKPTQKNRIWRDSKEGLPEVLAHGMFVERYGELGRPYKLTYYKVSLPDEKRG